MFTPKKLLFNFKIKLNNILTKHSVNPYQISFVQLDEEQPSALDLMSKFKEEMLSYQYLISDADKLNILNLLPSDRSWITSSAGLHIFSIAPNIMKY